MKFILDETNETISGTTTATSTPLKFGAMGGDSYSVQASVDVDTPTAKTFDDGTNDIQTANFPTVAGSTGGDYVVLHAADGSVWAAALNKSGTDPAPTGPIYVAIPSANKTNVNISALTTAAQVATAVKTALNLLTGFSAVITASDAAADGHLACTGVVRGVVVANSVHNASDSGAGSITTVVTTAGTASEVDIVANTVTIPAHGLTLGLKGQLTTTGTLPAGLSLATDYFIIVVDANTVKFATSLALAQAGTGVDITNQGSSGGVATFTPTALAGASIKLQQSNNYNPQTGVGDWSDLGSATNITVDAVFCLEKDRPTSMWVRTWQTLTAGHLTTALYQLVKGDKD